MVYFKALIIGFIVLGIIALRNISVQLGNWEWFISNAASLQRAIPEPGKTGNEKAAGENSLLDEVDEGLKLEDFRYPGSEVISYEGSGFFLKSDDNVEDIIAWYKNRITIKRMRIRNFIQTSTNGNSFNLFQAANNNENIKVEIEKKYSDDRVNIVVTINESI